MQKIKGISFSGWILLASLLVLGSFHEYISCALSAALCIGLFCTMHKEKKLYIQKNIHAAAVLAVCLGYGITCLWAVDHGMAFIGFLKFLPLGLYMLCLWQEEDTAQVYNLLPWAGVLMAAVSAIGMLFPALKDLFSVAGRLAGFFQYPNTFAIFLLVCQLLVIKKADKKIVDYILILALSAAILYTGSRTAFVVAVLSDVAMLFLLSRKKARTALLVVLGVAALGGVVVLLDGDSVIARYLSISLTESTFVGRILYYVDALPLLLKYPFGMGYMGYYYVQNSIQTGVYSVTYIHNDFLQLLLDIGWVPGGLFIASVVRWLLRKDIAPADKLVVAALCVHSLLDFNLQFTGVFLLLLTLMYRPEKRKAVKTGAFCKGAVAVTAAVAVYMGCALALAHWGQRELSEKLYPFNTQNKMRILETETDLQRADALADEILAQNESSYVPYSIKGKYAYSQGNFTQLIQYKRQTLERNVFGYEEYEEYCAMLINGASLYRKKGDVKSADFCLQELKKTRQLLNSAADRLSKLGALIDDQPKTELSEELLEQIRGLEAGQ